MRDMEYTQKTFVIHQKNPLVRVFCVLNEKICYMAIHNISSADAWDCVSCLMHKCFAVSPFHFHFLVFCLSVSQIFKYVRIQMLTCQKRSHKFHFLIIQFPQMTQSTTFTFYHFTYHKK